MVLVGLTGWKLRKRKWTDTTERLIKDLESSYGFDIDFQRMHLICFRFKYIMVEHFEGIQAEGYTGKSEPLYYNYLIPLTSLDEGLYALACEEDVCCLATLVRSFKLIEVIEHVMGLLLFEETKLDGEVGFGDVAGSGIDSSGLSHDESFRVDDLDLNLNEPVDLNVSQTETQSELHVPEEPDVGQWDSAYESQYDVQFSEDAGTDNDDEDDDFLVDEENEIVEPDVDVHLFGIIMDVPFDNIGVTNLVLDDVIEGKDVDAINPDGFDSDPGNDNETSYYGRRRLAELNREMEGDMNASGQWKSSFYTRQKFNTTKEAKDIVYLNSIESRRNLKLYKNDSVTVRARCDRKVPVFTMSQGTGPTSLNQGMEVGPSGSSGPTIKSKKRKNTCTNDDSQACSSALDAHDKGDLCLNIFNQVRVNPKIPVKAVQDQLRHDLELQKTMRKAFRAKAKAEREIRGDHVM
ncbi:hypothetical protein Tco_1293412 [Tanacetum coccineum]